MMLKMSRTNLRLPPQRAAALELAPKARHRMALGGFTLTEVLIATIILAIGLIGLGAIFPAVITQQQQAADLTAAITAGANAESVLVSKADGIRAVVLDPASEWDDESDGEWVRVISTAPDRDLEGYLRMPFGLGLPNREENYVVGMTFTSGVGGGGAFSIARPTGGSVRLPYRPIRQSQDGIVIRVRLYEPGTSNVTSEFTLTPDPAAMPPLSKFTSSSPARLRPSQPNDINFGTGELEFHFGFNNATEEVQRDSVQIDYDWVDDLIASNPDRLYPQDSPRIAWEMLLRKGLRDQVQYCLFMYRFDVPVGLVFDPDRPTSESQTSRGMLRQEQGRFEQIETNLGDNRKVTRFYLRSNGNALADVIERGAWILPINGVEPLQIRRVIRESELRFGGDDGVILGELDRAPLEILSDGRIRPLVNQTVDFWYMPFEVTSPDDPDNVMRVRPVLAYTKQLNF